jgi:membrane protein implicated in regulation of membrane protease activity
MGDLATIYAAHPLWVWLAVGAALLAFEVATGSGWLLWPAASAAVVAVVTGLVVLPFPYALGLFALLTIASTLLARRYLPRSVEAQGGDDINDNVGRLVGHHGKAVAAFQGRAGRVFIDGKEWAAELDDDGSLEAGARVEVVGVHGARLRVRGA